MADMKMIYDFETTLRTILNAQSDIITLVQKWGEMLASDPHDVTFNLKGEGGEAVPYSIPNIQKVIDTLGERALPSDPIFNSVTAKNSNGSGKMTPGGIEFRGRGEFTGFKEIHTGYSAWGITGDEWTPDIEATLTHWPVPRYWYIPGNGQRSVDFNPDNVSWPSDGERFATDFFVHINPGASLKIKFRYKTMLLGAGGNGGSWHVYMRTNRNEYGLHTYGYAVQMTEMEV